MKKTIRITKEAVEYRRMVRMASIIRTEEYRKSLETVRKVHISQERCTSL